MLLSVATSMCDQRADAHDLVQETLTRAWRSFDSFDGDYPRAWLLTILRNASHNEHRRKRPIVVDLTDPAERREPEPAQSAEQTVIDATVDAVIASAISTLKPQAQELLVMVDVDGLSYREASAALGIPEGTVMSRLHRARAKVRKHVERDRKRRAGGSHE